VISTVTLNAAIDKTYYVPQLQIGRVHRVTRQIADPGGKGVNVAKVIRLLGGDTTATGFIAGNNGRFIEEELRRRGVATAFVKADGESRLCLNIMDETTGESTEVLELGADVGDAHVAELKAVVRGLAQRSSIVAMSGSLPPGVPTDLYAELIGIVRAEGARAFLDTSGKAFGTALASRPYFVKPNEQELAQWLGREDRLSDDEVIDAAWQLADTGIEQVCVTLGERGAVAILQGSAYRVTPPKIQAVNAVGCGDSFVAGLAFAEERCLPPEEKLRIAAAASAANAMSDRAGHIEQEVYEAYLEQVEVRPIL